MSALQLYECMHRHPDQIVVWLDLDELAAGFTADIGVPMGVRPHRGRLTVKAHPGTNLAAPTEAFVQLWESLTLSASIASQKANHALLYALAWPKAATIQVLAEQCASHTGQLDDTVIFHPNPEPVRSWRRLFRRA